MQVNFKIMRAGAKLPTKGTPGANGLDIFYPESEPELLIKPKLRTLVPSGFAIEIPNGYCVFLMSRSGQGHKQRVRLSNSVGLIDTDYRGELMLSLTNDGTEDYEVKPGQAIGQIVFVPVLDVTPVDVGDAELNDTQRGASGFGSTDGQGITSRGALPEDVGTQVSSDTVSLNVPVVDPTDVAAQALGAAPVTRPVLRTTYTTVSLAISGPAYAEIENKLRHAGYDHVFHEEGIDMTGISLVRE